ncbi:Hypothetical_protein [Hexamita inflata]|uniref:Hypothetical_protein n=1 Tax=Hexamita inflata TaxID=28002 RepID=A0AA86UWV4_9EUKA|nr:Hypothetical protein HINF_LOCUS55532 [Hexamita inflata]
MLKMWGRQKMKLFYFNISKGTQCVTLINFHSKIPKKVKKYYCHKNYPKENNQNSEENDQQYQIENQQVPLVEELTFYNKILKVHYSHKQIRKIKSNVSKYKTYLAQKKQSYPIMLNSQILNMNKEVELLVKFIQYSNSYMD